MLVAIGLGLCAAITAIISDDQGRSPIVGLIIGLLLGPLGIIFALMQRSLIPALDPAQLAPAAMDTCPRCSEPIPLSAFICKHCGRDVLMPTVTRP